MWSYKQVQRIWSTLLNYSLGTFFLVIMALTLHIQLCQLSTLFINHCKNLCLCYIYRLPYLTETLKPDLIFFQAGVDPHKGDSPCWYL